MANSMDKNAIILYILDSYEPAPVKPMTITIELPPEIEAGFAALAAARGVTLQVYLQHLLEEQIPARIILPMSPAERGAAWRESAKKFPHTPPLSDEAISRENLYAERG